MSAPALPPWLHAPLAQALHQHRGHALLLHGPAGLGHWELASTLARAWLCETPLAQRPQGLPCGTCAGCRLLANGSHPDLRVVMPETLRARLAPAAEEGEADAGEAAEAGAGERSSSGRRKPSRDIKVDDIRRASAWCAGSTSRGGVKVLLLHAAQAMNLTAANALLKTLEEPPGPVRLLLTATEPERLLPTVRSRCQALALATPPAAQALDWLSAQGLADAEAMLAAAGGRPFEALELAAEGLDAAFWRALPARAMAGDAQAFLALPVPRVVDALLKLCHDTLALGAGAAPRFLPGTGLRPPRALQPVVDWHRALLRVARHAEHPWQAPLLVESLLSQAAAVWAAPQG